MIRDILALIVLPLMFVAIVLMILSGNLLTGDGERLVTQTHGVKR